MNGARLTISASAIDANYQTALSLHNNHRVFAVVKSNAYGHGLVFAAKAIKNAYGYAVCRLEEGLCLRKTGIKKPILLLQGAASKDEWAACIEHAIMPVLHHQKQLSYLRQTADYPSNLPIWIKVNTGMNRLGFSTSEAAKVYDELNAFNPILMSHYACADVPAHSLNVQQQQRFNDLNKVCKATSSLANSAALLAQQYERGDIARAGIMLYGHAPYENPNIQLATTMRFEAPVIALQWVEKGQAVGYGSTWAAPEKGQIAILRVGYADGYPRILSNQIDVAFKGQRYPLAGCISMDMCAVFVGENKAAIQQGDWIELWGDTISVKEVAQRAQTIPYELFTGINERVSRCHLD